MGDTTHSNPNPDTDDGRLLPLSPSLSSQTPGCSPNPKHTFFALIMPPATAIEHPAHTVFAQNRGFYFAIRGDSIPELCDDKTKSTQYILTDVHGCRLDKKLKAEGIYLAVSFSQPSSGFGPEASECVMFILNYTRSRKQGSVKRKTGRAKQLIEVFVVSKPEGDIKQRLDDDFISRARLAFSREFGDLQPMVPHGHHGRLGETNTIDVNAGVVSNAGPSRSGPCNGAGGEEGIPRPVIRKGHGDGLGPMANAGQGDGPPEIFQKRLESYGAIINATAGFSADTSPSDQSLFLPPDYVTRPFAETLDSATSRSDGGRNVTDINAYRALSQSRTPSGNILASLTPTSTNHLSIGGNEFPSSVSQRPATDFPSLSRVAPTQDLLQFPFAEHVQNFGGGHAYPPQTGLDRSNRWSDHPTFNVAIFTRNGGVPQKGIQHPQFSQETPQGGKQARVMGEQLECYSQQFYSGYQEFSGTNTQPLANLPAPQPLPNYLQTSASTNVHTPVYPGFFSQLNGPVFTPNFTPFEAGRFGPPTQSPRHPPMGMAGRNSEKRKAQNPYPGTRQRMHMGVGSAATRAQAREDRLGEGIFKVSGTAQTPLYQNVPAEGSQLAHMAAEAVLKPPQPTQFPMANYTDNFLPETSFCGDYYRLFPSADSHHVEPMMSVAENGTDWYHAYPPIEQNLQQHGPIPPFTAGMTYSGNVADWGEQ